MTPTFFPVRPRSAAISGAAQSDGDTDLASQERLAAQESAFDGVTAEHAEMLRERNALEALMLQDAKNEDAIMKKWIALI
ncbi:MAG: hypothetical protein ACREMP_03515 [Candidatus Tyrphobacter sp.]